MLSKRKMTFSYYIGMFFWTQLKIVLIQEEIRTMSEIKRSLTKTAEAKGQAFVVPVVSLEHALWRHSNQAIAHIKQFIR